MSLVMKKRRRMKGEEMRWRRISRRREEGRDRPGAIFARDADLCVCFSTWGTKMYEGGKFGVLFVRLVMVAICVSRLDWGRVGMFDKLV